MSKKEQTGSNTTPIETRDSFPLDCCVMCKGTGKSRDYTLMRKKVEESKKWEKRDGLYYNFQLGYRSLGEAYLLVST